MRRDERVLYHQIHPLKLFTDVATAIAAAALLWQHRLVIAVIVGFVPSVLVTVALLQWADLEPYRQSAVGLPRTLHDEARRAGTLRGFDPVVGRRLGTTAGRHRAGRRVDRRVLVARRTPKMSKH